MSNVRALAAGAITLFAVSAGRPRSGRRTDRGGSQTRLSAAARSECSPGPRAQESSARIYSNRGAGFEQNAWHWRGLRKVGFLRAAKSHTALRPPTGFALKFNSMQTHVYRSGTQPRFKSAEGRLGQAPSAAGGAELAASENERPNHSIERTHNGGAQLRAPSSPAAPLCAAHVKR